MFLSHPDHIMTIHRIEHDARIRRASFARLIRALRRGRRARPLRPANWLGSPPQLFPPKALVGVARLTTQPRALTTQPNLLGAVGF